MKDVLPGPSELRSSVSHTAVCLSPRRQSLTPSILTLAANSWFRRGGCITLPLPNLESYLQESGGFPGAASVGLQLR
jgi:hypothetical protein